MMTWRTRTLLILPLLLACAAPAAAQARAERWTLVRELRIGADEGEGALSSVSAVAVGRDGSVYVAQPQEAKIRRFGPDGRFAGAFGRRGRGPGEFGNIVSMGWRGDTLWASDPMQARVQLFDRGGKLLGSSGLLVSNRGGLLSGGRAVTTAPVPTSRIAQGLAPSVPLLAVNREGRVLDTLRSLSTRNAVVALEGAGGRSMSAPNPFADHTLWGVHPDGGAMVVVDRPAATQGGQARFRVTRLDPAGRTLFSRAYVYTPQRVTGEHFGAVAERWSGHVREAASRGGGRTELSSAKVRELLGSPRFHPPVTRVVAGRDGTVWLRREDWGQPRVTWTVLDERGNLAGFFDVPAGVEIVQADRGAVWTLERDEMDVPFVVRYRVRGASAVRS